MLRCCLDFTKCCSMIRCFGLQKQSYAILPDYLRVLAGPGYSGPHVSLRQSPFTCRVRFSIPRVFFLASPICWRRIHHDLTSFFPPPRRVTPSRSWRPKLNRCRLWWPAHAIASPPWGCCCSTSLRCKTSLGFLGNRWPVVSVVIRPKTIGIGPDRSGKIIPGDYLTLYIYIYSIFVIWCYLMLFV